MKYGQTFPLACLFAGLLTGVGQEACANSASQAQGLSGNAMENSDGTYRRVSSQLRQLQREFATGTANYKLSDRIDEIRNAVDDLVAYAEKGGQTNLEGMAFDVFRMTSHEQEMECEVLGKMRTSKAPLLAALATRQWKLTTRLRSSPANLCGFTMDGTAVSLSDLRGKVVLISIWNRSCSSCLEAFPKLKKLYGEFQPLGFDILGICVLPDSDGDEAAKASRILAKHEVPWANVAAEAQVARTILRDFDSHLFGGVYFLLDKEGRLVTTDIAGGWLNHHLRELLCHSSG